MRKWLPLLTVCLGTFMLLVDVTIVSVAIPAMTTDLDSSFSALQWVVDLYVLVLAALLMATGSASDLLGRRKIYLIGMIVFAVASLACGLAPNSGFLIVARGVQGLGAAAMFATNTALLAGHYSGRDRGVAFGIWGAVNGAAAAAGPILGGLLTEHVGWRSIFLVNIPVAVIAVLLGLRYLTESKQAGGRIDVPGTVSFTGVSTLTIFGLIRAGDEGWTDPATLGVFGGALVALIAFVLIERSRRDPMLDLSLMRTPSFGALMTGAVALNGAAFASLVFVSVWAQSVLHLDPVAAGLVLTPLSGMAFVVSGLAGRFLSDVAPQWPIGIGLVLIGAGGLLDMLVDGSSAWTALLPGLLVTGVGVGLSTPTLASAALAAAPASKAGMAGSAANTFRQLGFALGIPVLGTVLGSTIAGSLAPSGLFSDTSDAAESVTSGQTDTLLASVPASARADAAGIVRDAYASGLDRIFLIGGITALATGVLVLLLVRPVQATKATDTVLQESPSVV